MSEDFPKTDSNTTPPQIQIGNPMQVSAATPGGDSVTQFYTSPALGGNQWTSGEHAGNYVVAYNGYGTTALTAYPSGQISINNTSIYSTAFDYQQGLFTPTLSTVGVTGMVQTGTGFWSIIGNVVTVNVSIDFTYTSSTIANVIALANFPTTPVNLMPYLQVPAGVCDGVNTNIAGYANPLTFSGFPLNPGQITFTVGSGLGNPAQFQIFGSPGTQRIRFSATYIR